MPAELISLAEGPNILLDKPVMLLGRHVECDVQLNSRKVSRRHCCIAQINDDFIVRDLGSTNGVRVNGQRVREGRIQPGDELTVGNFKYRLQSDKPSSKDYEPPRVVEPPMPAHRSTLSDEEDDRLELADNPVPLIEARESQILPAVKPSSSKRFPPAKDPFE